MVTWHIIKAENFCGDKVWVCFKWFRGEPPAGVFVVSFVDGFPPKKREYLREYLRNATKKRATPQGHPS